MVILDATAGNRMMWPNKNPPLTVYMDKKTDLRIPPDVIGVWEYPPFRDDVFSCVLFDPPHIVRTSGDDSRFDLHASYGCWRSREIMVRAIMRAQREFARLANRLCFKWGETRDSGSLWRLLPLFTEWREIHRRKRRSKGGTKNDVWWVTFIHSKSN